MEKPSEEEIKYSANEIKSALVAINNITHFGVLGDIARWALEKQLPKKIVTGEYKGAGKCPDCGVHIFTHIKMCPSCGQALKPVEE